MEVILVIKVGIVHYKKQIIRNDSRELMMIVVATKLNKIMDPYRKN